MIRLNRLVAHARLGEKKSKPPLTPRAKLLWTIGNALMLVGIVIMLYVGGLYAMAEYGRYAARGDTDVPAFKPVAAVAPYEPAPFTAPVLNQPALDGQVVGAIPDAASAAHQSTVSRVVIPSVGVDSKVVEVGWEVVKQKGQEVAVWQVAEYAVGHHQGSANPGAGGNVVLAGHVGGYGKVFKDLYYINPGDQVIIYSAGQQYLYTVQERLVLHEEGAPPEERAANAEYIAPSDSEVVTLVTCWPAKGADKFKYRVVVRAVPFAADVAIRPSQQSNWSVR